MGGQARSTASMPCPKGKQDQNADGQDVLTNCLFPARLLTEQLGLSIGIVSLDIDSTQLLHY